MIATESPNPTEFPIPSSVLQLREIRRDSDGSPVCYIQVGGIEYRIVASVDQLQDFQRFQALCFRTEGCWPQFPDDETGPISNQWEAMVVAAIYAGGRAVRRDSVEMSSLGSRLSESFISENLRVAEPQGVRL